MKKEKTIRIGILGAGPSGLFLLKRLINSSLENLEISIFERKSQLGAGMPYSSEGANDEHITNVSGNEIPDLVTPVKEWIKNAPGELLKRYGMAPEKFSEYKVLPRLLFGQYLTDQFELLLKQAKKKGITTNVYLNTEVTDIVDQLSEKKVVVVTAHGSSEQFDHVIISTGHTWPLIHEGIIPDYFDSPYPPSKLALKLNHPVAIKGASLTAIDAVRTLSRCNGRFIKGDDGSVSYELANGSEGFQMILHSLDGLLPSIRFHLEEPQLSKGSMLSQEEIRSHMTANDGFVSLDYLFERNFKEPLRESDPDFYEKIRNMTIEAFVENMMSLRERLDPFILFKAEYAEAEKSIKRKESVHWKEMLASLSYAMNYPAKHLSAEDMIRLKKVLMPLISIVIAFVPQGSCQELLALHAAEVLKLVAVDADSTVEPQKKGGALYHYTDEQGGKHSVYYPMFIDCVGQQHLPFSDFPFRSLTDNGIISPARLKFKSSEEGLKEMKNNDKVERDTKGEYYLQVPGIAINDNFQVIDQYGAFNNRIYIIAVPYIGGYNPDYSGLDFCETASALVINSIIKIHTTSTPARI
ncbi:MAG TPA: FAD/NAD(P)-binding protein [Chitinophagaceae bacterium]